MNKIKKLMITLVALLAVTAGAWADGKVINTEISNESLKVGDILVEGFSISGPNSTTFYFNAGRAKKGETLLNEDVSFYKVNILSVGTNTVITLLTADGDLAIYTPIDENGQVANAWIVTSTNPQGNNNFHLSGYKYVAPASSGPEVDWDKDKKTGSFTMPGGNVELEPEYYPQAELTAKPTAIDNVPATTDGAIVKAGTVANIGETTNAQGTVMYYVSTTALDDAALLALAADAWTADVPTAESFTAAGQAYVYYYVRGNDSDNDDEIFSDGDILSANALTVTIAAAPTYAVTFADDTAEPDKWTASPATNVTKGEPVTVTYTGTKKVLGVKAEKKAAAVPKAAKDATAEDLGKLIGADGNIYDDADAATAANTTAVAKIFYVGSDAETSTTYNHGLALALSDVSGGQTWCSQTSSTCLTTQYSSASDANADMAGLANTDALVGHGSHTHNAASAARNYNSGTHPTGTSEWFLPSDGQWYKMATAAGGYGTLKTNAGLQSDDYWSSSEYNALRAWRFTSGSGVWDYDRKSYDRLVRPCLAF